jgi:hypothetical protein
MEKGGAVMATDVLWDDELEDLTPPISTVFLLAPYSSEPFSQRSISDECIDGHPEFFPQVSDADVHGSSLTMVNGKDEC